MCHEYVGTGDNKYLCSGEEDIIRYVAHSTGYNTQSNSWEDVGVVALPREEGASISQHHLVKGTTTGKDAPTLMTDRRRRISKEHFLCSYSYKTNYESLLLRYQKEMTNEL